MINNDAELAQALERVNSGIQDISEYMSRTGRNDGKIRFPTGYLRTCEQHRADFAFIPDANLRSNIAYTLLALEVLKWLNDRTTLTGQAMTMIFKVGIVLITSIVESLTKHYLHGNGGRFNYGNRVQRLLRDNIIDADLAQELSWVWDKRQAIHLYQIDGRDYERYSVDDVNRAFTACYRLREFLAQRGNR